MARGRRNNTRGAGDGALLAANRAIDKEDEYRRGVSKLQARTTVLAELLTSGGDIENVFLQSGGGDAENFLLECRNRVKALAEGNAKRMYEIDYFLEAVKEVKSEVETRQYENGGGGDNNEEELGIQKSAPNYEASIHEALVRARERGEADESRVPVEKHNFVLAIRQKLGEKVPKKRSRASRGADDDDDLEVVNENNIDDVHKFKCPITGMLFEDPVRNKVCGHTYSRAGLMQMVKNRKKTCPVPGCANNRVSLEQVEGDDEMVLKVRRFKTREDAAKRRRELEYDDDNEGENERFTVIN
eukprot:CAMPEP_0171330652 /NCGR_PEP_ID=MMETSP0878-20121228/2160_1 /TAXON_ID=67004 /ORGANISM="Thalassiosira weissflogii, Strain CCMP1336" /LENGTH=300 /DNA_ID=CAMNT_0011831011 /DNA_START=105 /DNA_END=1007 /DNA_ORIENTATION=+